MLANQIGLSGKYVSERHHYASQHNYTAGESAKLLSKKVGVKISAKEIVAAYKLLNDSEPEWHHSGFYKASGKSTMGRTFFFSSEDIESLALNWSKVAEKQDKVKAEDAIKAATTVSGFYYIWDHDYSGRYGKKVNFKVLATYSGSLLNAPKNFTACTVEQFECVKLFAGRKYYGWNEPTASEFTEEKRLAEIARIEEVARLKSEEENNSALAKGMIIEAFKTIDTQAKDVLIYLLKNGEYGKNASLRFMREKGLFELADMTWKMPYSLRLEILKEI